MAETTMFLTKVILATPLVSRPAGGKPGRTPAGAWSRTPPAGDGIGALSFIHGDDGLIRNEARSERAARNIPRTTLRWRPGNARKRAGRHKRRQPGVKAKRRAGEPARRLVFTWDSLRLGPAHQ